jgi:ribonuclease VapC
MNSSPNGGENPHAKRKSGVDFMAEAVLDASAVIALLFQEPGHDEVESQLAGAAISTVNVAEVADFLMRQGMSRDAAERAIRALELDMVAADEESAYAASDLYLPTRSAGLSLADRFCLALAKRLGRFALSADRAWTKVPGDVSVTMKLIR